MSWTQMATANGGSLTMQWKEMTGQERLNVVEMARKGDMPIKEICRTFGVSRQTLNKAMDKAAQAALQALEPKRAGRKARPEQEQEVLGLLKKTKTLEEEIKNWKTRYEVAQAFIDLSREQERQERRKDKKKKRPKPSRTVAALRQRSEMASEGHGQGTGPETPKPGEVDEQN